MTFKYRTLQDGSELDAFIGIIRSENCFSYLEIGSKCGGSLWEIANAMPLGAKVVSVDLPGKDASRESLSDAITNLKKSGYNANVIWGNSTSKEVIDAVKNFAPFDVILIDGDHSLEGVTKDFENYSSLGRIVAFHDISWRRAPEWQGNRIEVPEFWNSVKSKGKRSEELRFCPTGKNNGIGVLWMA